MMWFDTTMRITAMTTAHRTEPPRIYPTFRSPDPDAVIRWLCGTVGFTERVVYRDDRGGVAHAELAFGSAIIMLGGEKDDEYGRMIGDGAGRRTDSIYVAVDDTDALFARVRTSGVTIEKEPYDTGHGSRDFICRDPGGGLWCFGTYWPQAGDKPHDANR
jgi:uncharacterized glyoxalase superfamily protein PhnB